MQMSEAAIAARRRYKSEWRSRNAEHIKEYAREWRRSNPEKIGAANARYWEKKAREYADRDRTAMKRGE